MKRVKNYIAPDLAKKKIARYKYWSIKDETGITITSSEDTQEGRSFADLLDKIIVDNVDAEIQVKFGTNEQSSRQNTPIFIRVNEAIEWIEPEEEETIKINGVPHRLDKNGNVNINLKAPQTETTTIESPNDIIRQEMELQLEGLRKENQLKEERFQSELHNKLAEQTLQFKEMMLTDRESRIAEREQTLAQQEAIFEEKQKEMGETIKGYAKHVPSLLGGLFKEWIKKGDSSSKTSLGKTEQPKKERRKVNFEFAEETENEPIANVASEPEIEEDEIDIEEIDTTENIESQIQPENENI